MSINDEIAEMRGRWWRIFHHVTEIKNTDPVRYSEIVNEAKKETIAFFKTEEPK